MFLQLIEVGKRHCRVLYILPAQPELILHRKCHHSGLRLFWGARNGIAVSSILVGKRHCRVLGFSYEDETMLPSGMIVSFK